LANVQIVRPRLGDNGPPANVNGRPEIYTHNHYNIPTNHNVHINHIHIIHENIKMLALGTEAQPINKSIKITQHNKGRSPSNGKLSDFSFYIDSQKSAHRKFKK
jgi:hypothetical protein